jgi:hypothetical protein
MPRRVRQKAPAKADARRAVKLPDYTLYNALVTPLIIVLRIPLMCVGIALEKVGLALQALGGLVPAWTDYQRRRS